MAASRIPPSRRSPEFAAQRTAKAVGRQTPGAGKVAAAAPVLPEAVAAALRGKPASAGGGSGLAVVSPDEPANPPTGLLWYDTDATC
jgi:hypothetical protein